MDSSRRRRTSPRPTSRSSAAVRGDRVPSGRGARPRRPACIRWTTRVRSPSVAIPRILPRRQTPSIARPARASSGGSAAADGRRVVDPDALDAAPGQRSAEALGEGLELGQLRHGPRPGASLYSARMRGPSASGAALMRAEDLTKTLDLTVLTSDVTEADIERACAEARDHHFAALCSYPRFVPLVAELLRGCDVKTCAVIDFPDGTSSTAERSQAGRPGGRGGRRRARRGHELPCHARRGLPARARRPPAGGAERSAGRAANDARGDVLVKVIIEAPLMNDKLKRLACMIVDGRGRRLRQDLHRAPAPRRRSTTSS